MDKSNMRPLILLCVILCLGATVHCSERSLPTSKADAFAKAILATTKRDDVDQALHAVDATLPDRSHVLPVLFERVASGKATDSHWAALCRIDSWGDGAWHLEMKGTAFDALEANPMSFMNRYLSGDDCALLLLLYAWRWTLEAPEVGGVDCADGGTTERDRFDNVIRASVKASIAARPPATDAAQIRNDILLGLAGQVEDAWRPAKGRVEESCKH